MSFRVVANVIDHPVYRTVHSTERLVLIILASWADEQGEVFSSKSTVNNIAWAANVSESQAVRILTNLVNKGLVNRELVPGQNSRLTIISPTPSMDATPSIDATPSMDATPSILKTEMRGVPSNIKGRKGKPFKEHENEHTNPATVSSVAGADPTASPHSPPASRGVLNGPRENENPHLSDQVIRRKMRQEKAKDWEIDGVLHTEDATKSYYAWSQDHQLPAVVRGPAAKLHATPTDTLNAIERMRK
jgi:hypothetical protein